MNKTDLTPVEKAALEELRARGEICMEFQPAGIACCMNNLVSKGYVRIDTNKFAWVEAKP